VRGRGNLTPSVRESFVRGREIASGRSQRCSPARDYRTPKKRTGDS
jgi:hypothetical protein